MINIKFILFTTLLFNLNLSLADQQTVVRADHIIRNPDSSFTIEGPVYLRGRKEMRFYSNAEGVCKLFGFEAFLMNTSIDGKESVKGLVQVDEDGGYVTTIHKGKPYDEVTCYNKDELIQLGNAGEILNNFDGSITLINPRLLRANSELPFYSTAKGVCKIFGHNYFLEGSSIDADKSVKTSIQVNDKGQYLGVKYKGKPYSEVTCYNKKFYKATGDFFEKIENADGSITLIKPVMRRGRYGYPLYTTAHGVCSLFGYGKPLSGSVVDSDKKVERLIILGDDGKFQKLKKNGRPYEEVTCLKKTGFFSFFD